MTAPYICSACCHSIVRQSLGSSKRQVAFASSHALESILSEASHVPRPRQRSRYSRPPPDIQGDSPARHTRPRNEDGSPQASDDFTTYIATAAARTSGRYSRKQSLPSHAQIPQASEAGPDVLAQRTSPPPRSYTSELEVFLKQGKLRQAWDFFLEHYTSKDSPALTQPSFTDVAKVQSRVIFTNLLGAVTAAWQRGLKGDSEPILLPSPAEVLSRFEKLGIASSNLYGKTLWTMSRELFRSSTQVGNTLQQKQQDSLDQLMDMWRVCLSRNSANKDAETDEDQVTEAPSWSFVHSDLLHERRRKDRARHFDQYFALFVPHAHSEKGLFNPLAASALLTYDILTHSCTPPSRLDATPYMEFARSMESLLSSTNLEPKRIQALRQRLQAIDMSTETIDGFEARVNRHTQEPTTALPVEKTTSDSQNVDAASQRVITELGRAIERQNLDSVERLWGNAQALLHPPETKFRNDNATIKLYEQFLMAFFKLRRPQSALHVWNTMIQSDIQPTVRTWSVMMKGCHISRDVNIMESMWRRMRESGVEPDVHAWSTRIQGLLKVGKVQEGLRALDEMGREWVEETRQLHGRGNAARHTGQDKLGNTNNASVESFVVSPKPDTAIMNSALSALGGRGKQYIPNVLTWGRAFAIEPDVITYNTLLNISLAQGHQEETISILKSMADAKVDPDSSTFTILLNSMFHSSLLKGLDHAEQEQRILDFILSLESNGFSIDEKGYGILVDRLLKEYDNLKAVKKVLAHMASRRIEPTPHIYTILMTYYFDTEPPNLYAADTLWNHIQSRNNNHGAALDVIFYDRMMEGYARHGDVGRMMTFLTRMSKEGKRPGWLAMAAVVKCLAEKNEWDRLTQVVLDCHRQEGLLSSGLRGMKGQADFWRLVRNLGVLDQLGIDID